MNRDFKYLILAAFCCNALWCVAQKKVDAQSLEIWNPVPKVVTPGKTPANAPSDALILFDGKNLNEWCSFEDSTKNAGWTVKNGTFIVKKGTGNIRTKRNFLDYQLHLEWYIPTYITGEGQSRGNSGLFLGVDKGGNGYEIQILDNYNNKTYVNGQAGSVYKQYIPLVNANKKPGEWQTYDIVWTAPRFNEDGSLKSPARVTVFFNGILVQNNVELKGFALNDALPYYQAHGATPIMLQDHGDPSEPISFRNIWIRPL